MPIRPVEVSYRVGETIHGAPLTLTLARSTGGRPEWILRKDPAEQRDDTEVISGLTKETILAMAEAVQGAPSV